MHRGEASSFETLAINTTLTATERAAAARAMMAKVGLRPEHVSRYPHMFPAGRANGSPSPAP